MPLQAPLAAASATTPQPATPAKLKSTDCRTRLAAGGQAALLELLNSREAGAQHATLAALQSLTYEDDTWCGIAASRQVSIFLISLLTLGETDAAREAAAGCLHNAAVRHCDVLVSAGALSHMTYLLEHCAAGSKAMYHAVSFVSLAACLGDAAGSAVANTHGLVPQLVEILGCASSCDPLKTVAAEALANITAGTQDACAAVVSAGALPALAQVLCYCPLEERREAAARALGNITRHQHPLWSDAIVAQRGAVRALAGLVETASEKTATSAAEALLNVMDGEDKGAKRRRKAVFDAGAKRPLEGLMAEVPQAVHIAQEALWLLTQR